MCSLVGTASRRVSYNVTVPKLDAESQLQTLVRTNSLARLVLN